MTKPTTTIQNLTPQLAEAGKIKIGMKDKPRPKRNGEGTWQPPIKLDHFLITTLRRGDDGNLILDTEAMDACPKDSDGKIRAIPIALHSDKIDDVFPTRYALYEKSRDTGRLACTCTGDGIVNDKGGRCVCPKFTKEKRCKPNGILHCSIMIPGRASVGSVHKWRTTSIISIEQMFGSLLGVRHAVGTLRGIPLWLIVKPIEVSPGGQRATVYCCHVECREQDLQTLRNRALKAAQTRAMIGDGSEAYRSVPGVDEPPDEQAEVAEEFYPDATVDAELIDPVDDLIAEIKRADKIEGNADLADKCAMAAKDHPDRKSEISEAWKKRGDELRKKDPDADNWKGAF